jgi:hypothetical protein
MGEGANARFVPASEPAGSALAGTVSPNGRAFMRFLPVANDPLKTFASI